MDDTMDMPALANEFVAVENDLLKHVLGKDFSSKQLHTLFSMALTLKNRISEIMVANNVVKIEIGVLGKTIDNILNKKTAIDILVQMIDENLTTKLDFEYYDELANEYYHPWFSHYEYIDGMLEIGSLFVNHDLPENLEHFLSEVRKCYAFRQYNAVFGLCRILLEVVVRDLADQEDAEKYINVKQAVYKHLNPELASKVYAEYKRSSDLLHGRLTVDATTARNQVAKVFDLIAEMYNCRLDGL